MPNENTLNYTAIPPLRDAIFEYTRSYDNWGSDYSVTGLLRPAREIMLVNRHKEEIDAMPFTHETLEKNLKSFKGTAIHNHFEYMLRRFMNKNRKKGYLIERRIWDRINGRKISGKFDAYLNMCLYDWKTTSVWKRIFGDWSDFEKQLNLYAYLLGTCGIEVKMLSIIAWYLDWDKMKTWSDPEYPKGEIEQIVFSDLWSKKEAKDFLYARIDHMKKNEELPDDELELCTDKDMWAKPTSYAVMRPGQPRAVASKDMTTKRKAQAYIRNAKQDDKDTFTVECRPGMHTKCNDYCSAAPYCNQHQAWLKEAA
ncbi:hypothetical protein KAR91_00100 [Candidatus Pacearchaeota archaeon]|nr:hypothetical protein [Candidatus Pacearchaeota archaeon]